MYHTSPYMLYKLVKFKKLVIEKVFKVYQIYFANKVLSHILQENVYIPDRTHKCTKFGGRENFAYAIWCCMAMIKKQVDQTKSLNHLDAENTIFF